MHGVDEFCEVYFDDVVVPADRMLGKPGDGWRLAMDLLPYERSTLLLRASPRFTRGSTR
jgi:alkylation response protein AidB-like acyl-CoA dehydrogenase